MNSKLRDPFEVVRDVGCSLPNVEATTKYDGSPVLKVSGVFVAGLAMHASAEPDTLVVRAGLEEREGLLEDAPDIYYLTDYYRRHPVVLVRLSRVKRDALRDLLSVSWRMATAKVWHETPAKSQAFCAPEHSISASQRAKRRSPKLQR